jgi:uncharacterized membrane protein
MERTSSNRTLWIGLGILALLALIASSAGGGMLFGHGLAGPFGARPFVGPWLIGIWGFGLLIRLLFIGGLIFLVVRLFGGRRYTSYRDDDYMRHADLTPAEILRRRYAAGEITREQYDEMRAVI